jgi:hypothetical protein
MPTAHLEIEGHTIVFVGSFNPAIFQPAWFSNQGLIRQQEAEEANIDIIRREVVSYTIDKFRLEVLPERFLLGTTQPSFYEPLRDLAIGTFRILMHTPIAQMGINRDCHYKTENEESWHAIGDKLAPKPLWHNVLEQPGLRGLTMQGKRPDQYKGFINVRVEPSTRISPGILVNINDHYELDTKEKVEGADKIIAMLEQSWASSIQRSVTIAEKVVEF